MKESKVGKEEGEWEKGREGKGGKEEEGRRGRGKGGKEEGKERGTSCVFSTRQKEIILRRERKGINGTRMAIEDDVVLVVFSINELVAISFFNLSTEGFGVRLLQIPKLDGRIAESSGN